MYGLVLIFVMGTLVGTFFLVLAVSWVVGLVAVATTGSSVACALLHRLALAQAIVGAVAFLLRPLFLCGPALFYNGCFALLPKREDYPCVASYIDDLQLATAQLTLVQASLARRL